MQRLLWTAAAVAATTTVVVTAYSASIDKAKQTSYMAQLRTVRNFPIICQGVLVDPRFALFSRTCIEQYKADNVVVGASSRRGRSNGDEWIRVVRKYYSPNHTLDFAMLELSRPSKHRPVQILWDDLEPGKLVWFRGWFPFNKAESELMETKVEIPTNDKCQGKIDRHLYDHQVCGDNDRIDSCRSFFLGSLMIEIGGTDFLIGTLNMGNCVGDPKFQVFNRLSAGRSFIEPFLCRG